MKGIIITCVIVIVLCIWGLYESDQRWEQFKLEHACKKVGEKASSIAYGREAVVIPGQTGWLCNDGITYWK